MPERVRERRFGSSWRIKKCRWIVSIFRLFQRTGSLFVLQARSRGLVRGPICRLERPVTVGGLLALVGLLGRLRLLRRLFINARVDRGIHGTAGFRIDIRNTS